MADGENPASGVRGIWVVSSSDVAGGTRSDRKPRSGSSSCRVSSTRIQRLSLAWRGVGNRLWRNVYGMESSAHAKEVGGLDSQLRTLREFALGSGERGKYRAVHRDRLMAVGSPRLCGGGPRTWRGKGRRCHERAV